MKKEKGKFLKKLMPIVLIPSIAAAAAVGMVACNDKPDPTPAPTPDVPPVVTTTTTVSEIYDSIANNFTIQSKQLVDNLAEEKYPGSTVEKIFNENNNGKTQVLFKTTKNDKSTLWSASWDTNETIDNLLFKGIEEPKAEIIEEAGYTLNQKINVGDAEKSAKSTLEAKIADKIAEIESVLGSALVNNFGEVKTNENISNKFPGAEHCFVSNVREDGSFLAFTVNGTELSQSIVQVDGRSQMTHEQIYNKFITGQSSDYLVTGPNGIDLGVKYTAPALNPEEIKVEVPFSTIYNQVFGENYQFVEMDTLMDDLAGKLAVNRTNISVNFLNLNDNIFEIYYDAINSINQSQILKSTYKGTNIEAISSYSNVDKNIAAKGSLETYLLELYGSDKPIYEGSTEQATLVENLNNFKNKFETDLNILQNLVRTDFNSTVLFNKTDVSIDFQPYAQKLAGSDKKVIYSGVSETTGKRLDGNHYFNTGYYTTFDVLSVFETETGLTIKKATIAVPYYNNSAIEDRYALYLASGAVEGTDFITLNPETTEIVSPIILDSGNAKAAADYSETEEQSEVYAKTKDLEITL